MNRLDGKVALITGAARGIGEAIARAFHAEGAIAIVTDITDVRGEQVAAQLGPNATYRTMDVRSERD